MSKVNIIEIRHHDLQIEGHLQNIRTKFPGLTLHFRKLREEEVYHEGVLPPLFTLFCSAKHFMELDQPGFFNHFSKTIDEVRAKQEPGFYSGDEFKPVPSLAVFLELPSGEKMKFYIKEKNGSACLQAVGTIPAFLKKYDLQTLKASSPLGFLAIYESKDQSWTGIGF